MIEESKYRTDMMNKHFNKELVMTKEDKEDFQNCTNYWIFDNVCLEVFVKVRAHFIKMERIEHLQIDIAILKLNQILKFF